VSLIERAERRLPIIFERLLAGTEHAAQRLDLGRELGETRPFLDQPVLLELRVELHQHLARVHTLAEGQQQANDARTERSVDRMRDPLALDASVLARFVDRDRRTQTPIEPDGDQDEGHAERGSSATSPFSGERAQSLDKGSRHVNPPACSGGKSSLEGAARRGDSQTDSGS
jgi:hypothetical protein